MWSSSSRDNRAWILWQTRGQSEACLSWKLYQAIDHSNSCVQAYNNDHQLIDNMGERWTLIIMRLTLKNFKIFAVVCALRLFQPYRHTRRLRSFNCSLCDFSWKLNSLLLNFNHTVSIYLTLSFHSRRMRRVKIIIVILFTTLRKCSEFRKRKKPFIKRNCIKSIS